MAILHSYMYVSCTYITQGEGFSLLGETGPPKGEEAALPTTLSPGSAPATAPVLVVSSISVVGGASGGGRGFEEAILVQTTVVECENKSNKR